MKKIFLSILFLLFSCVFSLAEEESYQVINDGDTLVYSNIDSAWSLEKKHEDDITFKKVLYEGNGSHSIYNNEDGSLGFALATDCELISGNNLIIVDNNLLKYYKLEYDFGEITQVELTESEIKEVFPQAEIFKLSQIDADNKVWIHKPFRKKRVLIFVNDTNQFFHSLTCKSKKIQDSIVKGLVTISRYGIIRFSHLGEYKGKLTIYVR